MFKQNILFLLIGHIIGDFYAPANIIVEENQRRFTRIIMHSLVCFATFMMITIPFASHEVIGIGLLVSALHVVIDMCKFFCIERMEKIHKYNQNKARGIFIIDQSLHLVCLFGISYFMVNTNIGLHELAFVADVFDVVGISKMAVGSWILTLLIIHTPANILIQKVIGTYKPANRQQDFIRDHNAGRMIGTIERIIIVILISIH